MSSGAEVPNETTVTPIKNEGTRKMLAKETAPLTNKSPPIISKANPKIKKNILDVITYHCF